VTGERKETEMTPEMKTVIYPAEDIGRAKELFGRLLGVAPYVDEPYYVGFRAGSLEVGLDPNGHRDGATCYWHVEDIESTLATLAEAGAEVRQPATDVGGGKLTAIVKDPEGNLIGLIREP